MSTPTNKDLVDKIKAEREARLANPKPTRSLSKLKDPHINADDALAEYEKYYQREVAIMAVENEADTGEPDQQSPFPLGLLPAPMRGIIAEASQGFLVPHSLPAACTLSSVACVLGAGLEVYSDSAHNATLRANLFMMPVAQSGTGKGRAYGEIMRPVEEAAKRAKEEWGTNVKPTLQADLHAADAIIAKCKKVIGRENTSEAEVQAARAEMASAVKDQNKAAEALEFGPVWNAGETTREKLAAMTAGQIGEAISVMSGEARGIVSVLSGRYTKGESDEDIYLSLYSGDSISINRKCSPTVNLHRPCGTVLIMLQPDKARELMGKSSMTESGFFPRFCAWDAKAEAEPLPEVPHRISPAARDSWSELIETLASEYRNKGDDPRIVRPVPEAFTVMRAFDNECRRNRRTGGKQADIASYSARWAENAWKLALVLHAGQHGADAHKRPLSETTAKDAVELMQWFIAGQLELLSVGRNQKRQARLTQLRELVQLAPKTMRDLANSHGFKQAEVQELVASTPLLEIETIDTGGRPSPIVRIATP